MIESTLQAYLKDAIRNVEIKVFKAVLYTTNGKKIKSYFTSRFELGYRPAVGSGSVYAKLESLRNILNSTNENDLDIHYQNQRATELKFPESISCIKDDLAGNGPKPE